MNRTQRKAKILAAVPVALILTAVLHAVDDWTDALGDPVFSESFNTIAPRLLRASLTVDKMTDAAQACAGFVNAYQLSQAAKYRDRARQIADFLASNANLASDGIPGWGPRLDKGYGFFPDRDNFTGKDLWDTTRALNCLLKVASIDDTAKAGYVTLARSVVDHWPYVEKRLANDGPYAAAGMRFYYKDEVATARKYVKNTNIAMAEVLFRLAAVSGQSRYSRLAEQTLNAELWEILTRHNFGYHGAMIYVEPDDPQNKIVYEQHEKGKVEKDSQGNIRCRSRDPDPSCWNHLAFEAYELYQVHLLSSRDLSQAIDEIMRIFRTSPLGDTQRFDWTGKDSPTHVTAYNCYLRNSGKTVYSEECQRALGHRPSGSMIFYSLVPDDIVR